jgi:hypothetical protein
MERVANHTRSFVFALNEKVTLLDIKRPGVVTGISLDCLGIQYRVVYWNDSQRRTEWVFEWEIEAREEIS